MPAHKPAYRGSPAPLADTLLFFNSSRPPLRSSVQIHFGCLYRWPLDKFPSRSGIQQLFLFRLQQPVGKPRLMNNLPEDLRMGKVKTGTAEDYPGLIPQNTTRRPGPEYR
jgi:hypothetical protein